METTQEAIDKLAALVNPGLWLYNKGYRGKRNSSASCPIAVYLQDKTGMTHYVNRSEIRTIPGRKTYSVPNNLKDLIASIDSGQCPELLRTDESL